jgi:hypothetical protein
MICAALSWPLMLLSVSLLLSTVLLSFHDLCCSLMASDASFSFSAAFYSFFFPFMASAGVSAFIALLLHLMLSFKASLAPFTTSAVLCWPLLLYQQSFLLFHSLFYSFTDFSAPFKAFRCIICFRGQKIRTTFSSLFSLFQPHN